jgi:aminopeptidase-like protein
MSLISRSEILNIAEENAKSGSVKIVVEYSFRGNKPEYIVCVPGLGAGKYPRLGEGSSFEEAVYNAYVLYLADGKSDLQKQIEQLTIESKELERKLYSINDNIQLLKKRLEKLVK